MRTTIITIVVLMLLAVGYVLSYAPVYRATYGTDRERRSHPILPTPYPSPPFPVDRIYAPAQWLIDETPLRTPMLSWAEVWGVYDSLGRIDRPVWSFNKEMYAD